MFPGHGSQYPLMGRSLYAAEPVFRDAVDRCAAVADVLLDIPLRSVLMDERISPEVIDQTAYAQPALFTISYALSCLWRAWGIRPAAVVGHSVGEFAAACVSGALPMHHALTMVIDRGRRTQALPAAGAMRAVFAPVDALEGWLPARGLDVAAVNTPTQTVISGPRAAVEAAAAELAAKGTPSAPIRVTQAFHSSLVEPMLPGFAVTAGAARPLDGRCPFFSTVTGRRHRGRDLDAAYWCRNSRAPVRFCQAIQTMADAGYQVFLEVGPRATLTAFAKESLHYYPPSLILSSSGRPPRTGAQHRRETLDLAKAVATLYVHGADVDWDALHAGHRRMQPAPALEGAGGQL
jgi:acyl transferase domain-containing protein